jgi:hypothetical protein
MSKPEGSNMDKDRSFLLRQAEAIGEHARYAHDCYRAYISIFDAIKNDNKRINIASGFFTIVMHSLVTTIMITLARLYDDREEVSLKKLIMQFSEFSEIDSGTECTTKLRHLVGQTNEHIIKLGSTISNLLSRRDKAYAHNDKRYFNQNQKMLEHFPISQDKLEKLINLACNFVFYLQDIFDVTPIMPFSENSNDLSKLLQRVTLESE